MIDENLQEWNNGYVYYEHSLYPLYIDVDYNFSENYIDVTIRREFRGIINKEMTKSSKVLSRMTKEQREEYILDVIDIFLNK